MKIQINTDDNVKGGAGLEQHTETVVADTLGHLAECVTRVEVHLSDENGAKGGSMDKRCLMEARVEGQQPIAVTDAAENLHEAIAGAAGKLKRSLDRTLGRLKER
jgi:ribosome-associated translation inhibitor RaiA